MRNMVTLFVLFFLFIPVSNAETVKYGVYGSSWLPWVRNNMDLISLYIYQTPRKPKKNSIEGFEVLVESGIEVYFVQKVHKSRKERWMQSGAEPDREAEVVSREISSAYSSVSSKYAINLSLDEENFWWGGRQKYLSSLYDGIKSSSPEIKVWQFFAEGLRVQRRKNRKQRFSIPSDGYIFDEYRLTSSDYEQLLKEYVEQGKPVVSILWASANWAPSGRDNRAHDSDWWNQTGWRSFYEKTMINRKYKVDTAYFIYDVGSEQSGKRLIPSYSSDDQCSKAFVEELFETTLPSLFSVPVQIVAPEIRPEWVVGRCLGK